MQSTSFEFLSVLGFLYLQNGKSEKAVTIFRTLHHLRPKDFRIAQSLCYALLQTERFSESLELANRWIAKTSDSEPRWKYLQMIRSRALFGLGNEHDARNAMQMVVGTNELQRSRK